MNEYKVYLTNLGAWKGSFPSLCEAVVFARKLGFETAIYLDGELIRTCKPY